MRTWDGITNANGKLRSERLDRGDPGGMAQLLGARAKPDSQARAADMEYLKKLQPSVSPASSAVVVAGGRGAGVADAGAAAALQGEGSVAAGWGWMGLPPRLWQVLGCPLAVP